MNESTSLGVSAGGLSGHGPLRTLVNSPPTDPAYSFEASRERVLLTLLALDLMLMAFFVVLNSTATFDRARSAAVAQSMTALDHAPPAGPVTAAGASHDETTQRGLAAVSLRAAVADVFGPFVSSDRSVATAANDDRVDVDMPVDLTTAGDPLPPSLLEGLAHVMANPPPGYRTELVIRAKAASSPSITAQLARLADGIVARGVASTALSVGLLAATVRKDEPAALRFSFLLLEPGEDSGVAHLDTAGDRP